MNQIQNLYGAVLMSQRDGTSTRYQPKKIWVLDLEMALIRKEQCKRSEWGLLLRDFELFKSHVEDYG